MQFRKSRLRRSIDISLDEFIELVKGGDVSPTARIRDRVLTRDTWRTVDNLRIFHRNSPVKCDFGRYLQQDLENEKRKDEQSERVARLRSDYSRGSLIEDAFQLQALAQIANLSDVHGAARFFVLQSFEPEQICTVVFASDSVEVEVAEGRTQLWFSLPQLATRTAPDGLWQEIRGEPFEGAATRKSKKSFSARNAPALFRSWSEFLDLAQMAGECSPAGMMMLDGVSYRHKVRSVNTAIDATWTNPREVEHPTQFRLIRTYNALMKDVSLATQ